MRKIDLIVVHCSATRETDDYTPEKLERDHMARGFTQTGYNYYVRRDGTLVPMRPLSKIPAHVRGHNRHSIGVCYEGGIDSDGRPADTRTEAQKEALATLLRLLKAHYPKSRICGHRDLAARKACPCFNAEEEYAGL